MKQLFAHFLKRWPTLYCLIAKIYDTVSLRRWEARLLGERAQERWWARRKIAEGYWNNREHPSKEFLVGRIAAFSPIHSILEVGCASGPNLYLIAREFPNAEVWGIDINTAAIKYGNEQFAKEGMLNVKLLAGKADELGQFQDRSFDIVFTNALLTHISPDKIKEIMEGMVRITRRALLLMEWHSFETLHRDHMAGAHSWIRDYVALLKQFIREDQIKVIKIPEGVWPSKGWQRFGWQRFGAVIEAFVGDDR